jgi:MSHA pilin protein MshC
MRASCTESARGFTLPELVMVLVLVGVLAAVALPKLDAALTLRNTAWHDQVVAALRQARGTALAHRRLVCADVATGSVQLSIATTHPASACVTPLPGPDGQAAFARDDAAAATTVLPAGTLYFQPTGRVTRDGAGTLAGDRTVTVAGEDTIVVIGETGHVE